MNIPLRFLARWTYQQRYGRSTRPITEVPGVDQATSSQANAEAFDQWLTNSSIDTLVLIDVGRHSPWYVEAPATSGLSQIGALVRNQSTLTLVSTTTLKDQDSVVEVWRRGTG